MTPAYDRLVAEHRQPAPVTVTQPALPPLADYAELLKGIWERRWLTNEGQLHQQFERALAEHLGVPHLSLFNNGTTALLVALQSLSIERGSVITTPFTFPATTHALHWNRLTPVFADVDPRTFNLDPSSVEQRIVPDTRAILAVHLYGNPCAHSALQAVADKHGLKLIYDAAQAFGVTQGGQSILHWGDASVLSFHATKVFSTVEGGALISKSPEQRARVNSLKNFGIADEETIIGPGINGKMNEFQAAFGLLTLRGVNDEIAKRRTVALRYRAALAGVAGIRCFQDLPGVGHNHTSFPITVDEKAYGASREQLHQALRAANLITRKYFSPLVSHTGVYAALPSAAPAALPVAERAAREVLCLPLYGAIPSQAVEAVCSIIKALPSALA
jgi:dTDP-4-amino-4,6-dideoxygalactose transaminase